jgi:hypothetical protein
MDAVKRLENLTLGETRKCPRCGDVKDVITGFHKGTSMCKECKKETYQERMKTGPSISTVELVQIMQDMAKDIVKMKRALKRANIELSDDDEPKASNPSEIPKKKKVKTIKSDVDTDVDEAVATKKVVKLKKTGADVDAGKATKKTVKSKSDVESSTEEDEPVKKSVPAAKKTASKPDAKKSVKVDKSVPTAKTVKKGTTTKKSDKSLDNLMSKLNGNLGMKRR